ncbi:MAG: GDP-mannose 4,6-dehydratase [Deltaproteobacteria bacterium]|nr:GDP-mannose 4,6-dehydratase [Deltaproteobacteria bacterium]
MPRALITGITGQDGSYLAEFLLGKGYQVAGLVRQTSTNSFKRIEHLGGKVQLYLGDLLDQSSIMKALEDFGPDEVYNLAAMSFVATSWGQPILTAELTGLGAGRVLEAVRLVNPKIRFYQASSSEMFGQVRQTPQTEETPFHPRSPYGVAKTFAHYLTVNYRESYGLFACSGILFNHESPRRGLEFVTRKVTHGLARIKLGLSDHISLGNLEAKRDWGDARDYVQAMWLMLQQDQPDDYVIGTGQARSVKDLVETACQAAGLEDWEQHVKIDPKFLRPAEVEFLLADPSKAKRRLGWRPRISFEQTIKDMVEHDLASLSRTETRLADLERRLKALEGHGPA